jgi:TonB-dependent SusC/RagA subfamily outer membrane receptor
MARIPAHRRWLAATVVLAAAGMPACHASPFDRSPAPQPANADGRSRGETTSGTVLERDDLDGAGAANMEELLRGRVAGLQVQRRGGNLSIQIRGPSTFSGSVEALVIVDGTETSARSLLAMDPGDVERIRVLKDGSAAMYGVRGANGVLIITTRRPGT